MSNFVIRPVAYSIKHLHALGTFKCPFLLQSLNNVRLYLKHPLLVLHFNWGLLHLYSFLFSFAIQTISFIWTFRWSSSSNITLLAFFIVTFRFRFFSLFFCFLQSVFQCLPRFSICILFFNLGPTVLFIILVLVITRGRTDIIWFI